MLVQNDEFCNFMSCLDCCVQKGDLPLRDDDNAPVAFKVDTTDNRFARLYQDANYAIDTTDPKVWICQLCVTARRNSTRM